MLDASKPKLRAADYHRYSIDLQNETSIADQARICQERMRREGWRECCADALETNSLGLVRPAPASNQVRGGAVDDSVTTSSGARH